MNWPSFMPSRDPTPEEAAEAKALVHKESEGLTYAEIEDMYFNYLKTHPVTKPLNAQQIAVYDAWGDLYWLLCDMEKA